MTFLARGAIVNHGCPNLSFKGMEIKKTQECSNELIIRSCEPFSLAIGQKYKKLFSRHSILKFSLQKKYSPPVIIAIRSNNY